MKTVRISQPTVDVVATGLRTSRPWADDAEYMDAQRTKGAAYYLFLAWELATDQIADGLHHASGHKFNRNKFVRDCGAHHYTCQHCFTRVTVNDGTTRCACKEGT